MNADIIKIGKCNKIILKSIKSSRQGWADAFKKMAKQGDDSILISDELDDELLVEWDK